MPEATPSIARPTHIVLVTATLNGRSEPRLAYGLDDVARIYNEARVLDTVEHVRLSDVDPSAEALWSLLEASGDYRLSASRRDTADLQLHAEMLYRAIQINDFERIPTHVGTVRRLIESVKAAHRAEEAG